MKPDKGIFPIIDMHCDLLVYLARDEDAHPSKMEDIGCAIPYLKEGNVKLQVLAIYSSTEKGSAELAQKQTEIFQRLLRDETQSFTLVTSLYEMQKTLDSKVTGIIAAIENASGLCEEDEPLEQTFTRLEHIIKKTERVLYLSLTHHGENRFGGGDNSKVGLKDDGKVLLDYLDDRSVAVDLSHTSDVLAHDILDYIDRKSLNIPIIASHSNFRSVYDHARNLPDDIASEIIRRQGLIGMNFLRAFLHPDDPGMLAKHIQYGFELGAEDALCFGADYYYWKSHPDKNRIPFFFKEHEHAGKYQEILKNLDSILSKDEQRALAYMNVMNFFHRIWVTEGKTSKQSKNIDK